MPEMTARQPEQFQEKCVTVFRPELRENKRLERFRVSTKNGDALAAGPILPLCIRRMDAPKLTELEETH
jgi:hypothetical protein